MRFTHSYLLAVGMLILSVTTVRAQPASDTDREEIPGLGGRTSDGFVVKCYWVGTYSGRQKFEDQSERSVFGQALTTISAKQTTKASFIATEELDEATGKKRTVLRSGRWESNVTNPHYWSKDGQRVVAGKGGAGSGRLTGTASSTQSGDSLDFQFDPGGKRDELAFDVEYRPLTIKGLKVKTDDKSNTHRWQAQIEPVSFKDERFIPTKKTVLREEQGTPNSDFYSVWTVTRVCDTADVKLITPRGDPRLAPKNSGDGQNEFTFDSASPGKLVINFKAKVIPSSAVGAMRGRVKFKIWPMAGHSFDWDSANPGGESSVSGKFLVAKATYSGLPGHYYDFGKKKVQLLVDGILVAETYIEVFFKRDATNHPGGQASSPNWYHYWLQFWEQFAIGFKFEYGGAGPGPAGEVKAMSYWNYVGNIDKSLITVYDPAKTKGKSYGVGKEFSGIDLFIAVMWHEAKHVDQIARADPLVRSNGSDCFRFGWSWNTAAHNHWNKGPDGQWGVANLDDDGNGKKDDANFISPFEPGRGDDQNLENPVWPAWPNVWPLPAPNNAPHPLESDAVNFEDRNHKEHQNARDDWGDPGKNHKINNRYDD